MFPLAQTGDLVELAGKLGLGLAVTVFFCYVHFFRKTYAMGIEALAILRAIASKHGVTPTDVAAAKAEIRGDLPPDDTGELGGMVTKLADSAIKKAQGGQ